MMKLQVVTLVSLLALPLGCSNSEKASDSKAAPASHQMESYRELSTVATVQAVDEAERRLTLKTPRGYVFTCKVDERVTNLPRIRPGDQVAITYTQSLAVQVVKKGEGQADQPILTDPAADGEQPRGNLTRELTMTAEVAAIDQKNNSITLRDGSGDLRSFSVRHPERLSRLHVGDHLWIRYTEGTAIAVEPARADAR